MATKKIKYKLYVADTGIVWQINTSKTKLVLPTCIQTRLCTYSKSTALGLGTFSTFMN